MNKATQDVSKLLGVPLEEAARIQNKMIENELDFSECSRREFNKAAIVAHVQLTIDDCRTALATNFDAPADRILSFHGSKVKLTSNEMRELLREAVQS
jgi:hypothetical protein